MSALAPKSGNIEISLEEKGNRALVPLFVLMVGAAGLSMSPLLAGGSWFASALAVAICAVPFAFIWKHIQPSIGATVVLAPRGIEFLKNGVSEFSCPWSSIGRIEILEPPGHLSVFVVVNLQGERVGSIPFVGTPFARSRLLGQIRHQLPASASITKRVNGVKGSRSFYGGMGLLLTSLALASLVVSLWSVITAATGSWIFGASTGLLFGGLVGLLAGIPMVYVFLTWNREERGDRVESVNKPYFHSLAPIVQAIEAGASGGRKQIFSYPPDIRTLRIARIRRSDLVTTLVFSAFFGLNSILLCFTMPTQPGIFWIRLVIALMTASIVAFPLVAHRKRMKEAGSLMTGMADQIEVEHLAVWVIRGGRRIPGHILSGPVAGRALSMPQDLNRMRVSMEVGGDTLWYDPSAMFNDEGHELLEAQRLAKLEVRRLLKAKRIGHRKADPTETSD